MIVSLYLDLFDGDTVLCAIHLRNCPAISSGDTLKINS